MSPVHLTKPALFGRLFLREDRLPASKPLPKLDTEPPLGQGTDAARRTRDQGLTPPRLSTRSVDKALPAEVPAFPADLVDAADAMEALATQVPDLAKTPVRLHAAVEAWGKANTQADQVSALTHLLAQINQLKQLLNGTTSKKAGTVIMPAARKALQDLAQQIRPAAEQPGLLASLLCVHNEARWCDEHLDVIAGVANADNPALAALAQVQLFTESAFYGSDVQPETIMAIADVKGEIDAFAVHLTLVCMARGFSIDLGRHPELFRNHDAFLKSVMHEVDARVRGLVASLHQAVSRGDGADDDESRAFQENTKARITVGNELQFLGLAVAEHGAGLKLQDIAAAIEEIRPPAP